MWYDGPAPTVLVLWRTEDVMNETSTLVFWLNDEKISIPNPDPHELLTEFLWERGLTGLDVLPLR
ncbi:MAG: hypothetical protein DWQ37_00265 [Planctomycetota bacterium]|nr:MAG: hypothetical protein DWQ37_00265 [Planctomycetota bacterium]